ncbi:RNA polymerase sigma factor SigJ [Actinomadura gamaensis]|uniref:RNA polymerase sigma factor SigJ n=1 Tax=Actinomadura gamaensis TaxID=1763541 RepID=A0ABV9UF03_9ACTN
MKDEDEVPAAFEAIRGRLMGVAYALLGSVDEAEDVVQEAWLRLCSTDPDRIEDPTGWLIVTVSRIARDVLKSARYRREEYVGPWLPEPVVAAAGPSRPDAAADPADRVTFDETLSMAMLVVLESLTPAERTAFVLHDVFGLPFDEVGRVVGRSAPACRQLAARARRYAAARAPRFEASLAEQEQVVSAFATACATGDLASLLTLLDSDVVLRSDGGGVVSAARRPLHGAERVARYLAGIARRQPDSALRPVTVNGRAGLLRTHRSAVTGVMAVAVADGRVTCVDFVRNPDKLLHVRAF